MSALTRSMFRRAMNLAVPVALAVTLIATLTLDDPPFVATAAEVAAAERPDFSGVWLPNAKASGRWPEQRPFTQAMRELRARWDETNAPIDLTRDDDYTSCLPYRLPYLLTTITQYPFEIVSTPRRVYVFTEVFGQVRRIDIDAPAAADEALPSRTGTSRGRWEGPVLVVETTHILPENEGGRYPGSPLLRVEERWSMENGGDAGRQFVNEVTIHDPVVYEQPVSIRMVFKPAGEVQVGEYICQQDLWDQHLDGSTSRIPWR